MQQFNNTVLCFVERLQVKLMLNNEQFTDTCNTVFIIKALYLPIYLTRILSRIMLGRICFECGMKFFYE